MPLRAPADLLPGLPAWGLVALFVAVAVVLLAGRRRGHGVLDRAGHYEILTRLVVEGAQQIEIGAADSPYALNPWDVPDPAKVSRKKLAFLLDLHKLVMGGLSPREVGLIGAAIRAVYAKADALGHRPRESMLQDELRGQAKEAQDAGAVDVAATLRNLVDRLTEYCGDGTYAYLLDRETTLPADARRVDRASPAGLPEPSGAAGLPRAAKAAASGPAAVTPTAAGPTNPDTAATIPGGEPPRPPGPPAPLGSRVASETLAPLADYVDYSRQGVACEGKVGLKLHSELPRDRWVMDSYVMIAGRRVPFVVLGETGVFAIWPLAGTPHTQDLEFFDDTAKLLQKLLPGYAGEVQTGMCRAFDPTMQPRWWLAPPAKVGGWVMGLDWLIPWLAHFGTEHGLGAEDVAHFDRLAGPHWERRARGLSLPRSPHSG